MSRQKNETANCPYSLFDNMVRRLRMTSQRGLFLSLLPYSFYGKIINLTGMGLGV